MTIQIVSKVLPVTILGLMLTALVSSPVSAASGTVDFTLTAPSTEFIAGETVNVDVEATITGTSAILVLSEITWDTDSLEYVPSCDSTTSDFSSVINIESGTNSRVISGVVDQSDQSALSGTRQICTIVFRVLDDVVGPSAVVSLFDDSSTAVNSNIKTIDNVTVSDVEIALADSQQPSTIPDDVIGEGSGSDGGGSSLVWVLLILAVALIGGGFWAYRYLKRHGYIQSSSSYQPSENINTSSPYHADLKSMVNMPNNQPSANDYPIQQSPQPPTQNVPPPVASNPASPNEAGQTVFPQDPNQPSA